MKTLRGRSAITATLLALSLAATPAYATPPASSDTAPQVSSSAHQRVEHFVQSAEADGVITQAEQEKAIAAEMRFIFDEATSVSADGQIDADYESLVERFGAEGAQNALALVYAMEGKTYEETRAGIIAEISDMRSSPQGDLVMPAGAFSDCVLDKSGYASVVALTNGTLTAYINDKNWTEAGKLIVRAFAKNAVKLTVVGVVANLTAAAGWCAFTTR